MKRAGRGLHLTGAVLLAMAVAAACGGSPVASPSTAPASSATGPAADLVSPVSGVVLHVDSPSLGTVTGFRLLVADGRQVDFVMGALEDAAEFPAAHLSEHVASSEPVLVYFRVQGTDLVVYRLEDAPAASPSGS